MSRADFKKVTITMPSTTLEYLETIGQRSRRTGGYKIAKTEIVRAMVTACKKLSVDFSSVKSEKDIASRILEAARVYSK